MSSGMKAAVFRSKAERCGPGRCMQAAILSRRFRVTTADDTLMVADGLGRSLTEEDWPDNTDEADRSISHPTAHPEHPPAPPPSLTSPAKPKTLSTLCTDGELLQEKVKKLVYFTETESPVLYDVLQKAVWKPSNWYKQRKSSLLVCSLTPISEKDTFFFH